MQKRVRDKNIKFRKIFAACRAVAAAVIFIIYGILTTAAGLEDMIVNLVKNRMVVLFLIQDILLILFGVFLFQFGCVYGITGVCQWNNCIRNRLRVGRRTLLHLSHLLLIPTFIYIGIGVIGEILYAAEKSPQFPHSADRILTSTIWIGYNQTLYKEIYSILMWFVSFLSILMYWVSVFNSSTFKFLWKKGNEAKAMGYIHDLKTQKPKISLICSNYNVRVVGQGGSYSVAEEETVTKKTETQFAYTKCFDASGDFKLSYDKSSDSGNILSKLFRRILPIKYVKLRLYWCYVWDREKNREDFENECKKVLSEAYDAAKEESDGEYARIEVKAYLKNFENSVLVRVSEDGKDPIWANVGVYIVSSLCGLSLFYRYLFDLVCADEKEFKIIKRISTDETINRRKVYDQNSDENDAIKKVYCTEPTSFSAVEIDDNRLDEIRMAFSRGKKKKKKSKAEEMVFAAVSPMSPVTPIPFECKSDERVSEVLDTRQMRFESEMTPLLE